MRTLLETTKTDTSKTVTFYVAHKIYWQGKRYADGDTIEVTPAEMRDEKIVAWLRHGWIEEMRDGKRWTPTPAAPTGPKAKKIPQTVSAELPLGQTAQAAITAGRGEFVQVLRSLVDPAPYNPRKTFREGKLQELADSIKTDGIIEPLIVRPVDGGRYEIVAGERRWRASGIAWPKGAPTLPCIVRQMDKVTAIRVQGIENLLRDDLNAIEECGWYDTLMHEGGYTVKDIVRETGLSEPSIYARLKLKDCPPEIKAAVAEGRVPASTAEKVARVDDPDLRTAFAQAILHPPKTEPGEEDSGVLSFRQAMRWLQVAQARAAQEAEWKAKVKASPLARSAAKVLTAEESDKVVGYGYVKDTNKYVRAMDICPGDPEQRTFAEVAKAAGRELPAPVLARDIATGKPMPILPRAETEKVLADLVPTGDEMRRRREQETERRQQETAAANAKREEAGRRKIERVQAALLACIEHSWSAAMDERFLRFAVGAAMALCRGNDEDEMIDALREFGVPVGEGDHDTLDDAWYREYLAGCDVAKLRGWLLYFAMRDPLSYGDYAMDEKQLALAEVLFGIKVQPQTAAVTN